MRIKTDWIAHLHQIRKRELDLIFSRCPEGAISTGLELGAGDCYQSLLLKRYVSFLVSSEYNEKRLRSGNHRSCVCVVCDAENCDMLFREKTFDLVYSSNLLEHLPNIQKALRGIHSILKDDGITIHVMPSPFWKFCHVAFFNPNRLILLMESILKRFEMDYEDKLNSQSIISFNNNPKVSRRISRQAIPLLPPPHGAFSSNYEELWRYRPKVWKKKFCEAGFDVIKIVKGPVASGYGFGLDILRNLLESAGVTSEYAYVAVKSGHRSPLLDYFA